MTFALLLIGIFLVVRGIIVSLGKSIFSDNSIDQQRTPNITINNYTTEQHVHITENQLKNLKK